MPICRRVPTSIAHVLVRDLGLVPATACCCAPNNPMMAACWFAVMKAGGIAVATMPLLRAKELTQIIAKGQVAHALVRPRLADELKTAQRERPGLTQLRLLPDDAPAAPRQRWRLPIASTMSTTAADDTCIFAFTSGTTGQPKATMHFHRDVMASCACWPPQFRARCRTCSSAARRWPSPSASAAWCCSR